MYRKKDIKMMEFNTWYTNTLEDLSVYPNRRHINSKPVRGCMKVTSCVLCTPCWLYSTFVRILLCPCTCGSSLGGNRLTEDADRCMYNCCDAIDAEYQYVNLHVYKNLMWVANSNCPRVQEQVGIIMTRFINVIAAQEDLSHKYQLIDQLANALSSLGYYPPTIITPHNAAQILAEVGITV